MAKQLNVNLSFTADTQAAVQKLQQLQNQLDSILMNSGKGISSLGLNKELTEALGKTAELKIALEKATNPNTGALDLSKFNESLRKSNTSITEYAQHLHSLGPAGQQAFSQLAASINQAEIPLRRSSTLLTEFATTLKNTARWQISSSILHGFMGTVQSAYGYAKDLNSSLNQIRIVTGQNSEQMARFAEQANRAAKSLNTTTTEYTNASLIYYQQGLDDAQVKERTDLTVKMANVSGQSAEEVSNQLTAVWNNFAKGGEDLEHFADVMVRLGADTASSSQEIAAGLEKFAAIGDTIGLSFDNAAAALATVTATTRESADTVGTAFKTIFARIQGLKLGETLEDGTDLNKYSQALMAVGISIKDQNGQLKDMDVILSEMGDKWTTLNRDQQVALAQTVAGVRQYNQLMALMDNFDFYEKNLESAKNADGSLDKQADTYAESWEAASKRVRAAAEDIYDSILDDDFFIKLTDGFAGFLNIIGDTIDGIGGMKGAIALLGVVITRVFAQDMSAALSRFAYNIKSFTAQGRKNLLQQQLDTRKEANQALRDFSNDGTSVGAVRADVNMAQANAQDALLVKSKSLLDLGRQLTDVEQKKAQIMLDQTRVLGEQAVKAAENKEQSEKTADALERQMRNRLAASTGGDSATTKNFSQDIQNAKTLQTEYSIGIQMLERFQKQLKGTSDGGKTFEKLKKYFKDFSAQVKESGMDLEKLDAIFDKIQSATGAKQFVNAFETELEELGASAQEAFDKIEIEIEQLEQAGQINPQQLDSFRQKLEQLQQEFSQTGQFTEEQVAALRDLQIQLEATEGTIATFQGKIPTMADGIVAFGNVLSSVTMAFTSLKGLFDTWNNEDATFGEKLIATFTTLGMVIPIVTTAFKAQNLAQMATMSSAIASALGLGTLSAAEIMAGLTGTAAAGGTIAFSTALWTLLWPIGLVMLAIVALVAVVAGLVMVFQDIERGGVDQRLKDINTTIDELKTTISETKQETEELTKAIENIQNGYDSIAKMTAGTEEYSQAIEKTNEQVMELLEKYPILYDYLTRDPNTNLLKIDQKGFDMVVQQQYAKLGAQQMALSAAQARKGELTIEKYNETWTQGGNNTERSGGNYANKLSKIGSYDQIAQMTDKELTEAVKNMGDLAQEIKYRQTGSSNMSGTASVDELPDNWQEQVRSDARELREAKASQNTTAADLTNAKNAVFQGTGKSLRGAYQVTEDDVKKIKSDTAAEVKKFTDTDWNDHANYGKNDSEWGAIQKVVKSYGKDASYVAQRQGEMIINTGSGEKKLTEEQFGNKLTEAVYEERLNKLIEENTKTVDQSLRDSGISQEILDTMSNAEQANLDNIKYAVGATLKDADAGNRLFGGMVNDFAGMNTDQASASLNAMADAFNSTDWSQGTAAVDDYMARLDELGIKIDGQNKATLEEYAGKFRDIAKLQEGAASYAEDLNKSLEQQAAEVGMSETAMNAYVDQLKENEKYAKLSDKQLKEAAINQKKTRNALDELAESWDSVKNAVKENDVMSEDYEKGLAALRKAYSQLFDLDVSDEFLTNAENIELMEKALKGNQEAFEELSRLAAQDWLNNLDFGETTIDAGKVLNVEGFKSAISQIETLMQSANWTPEMGINDDMITTLNEYVRAGKVTVDELNGYFGQVHGIEFDTEVEYMKPEEAMSSSTASTNTSVTKNRIERTYDDGRTEGYDETITSTVSALGNADVNEDGEIGIPVLKPKGDDSGGSNTHVAPKVDVTAGSNARASTIGKGGGGGGGGGGNKKAAKPKKVEPTKKKKKKDEVERYHEINEELEDLQNNLDKIANKKNEVWGKDKLALMDQEKAKLKELSKSHGEYQKQIAKNLNDDRWEAETRFGAKIDNKTGRITNYEELQEQWMNEWNAKAAEFDAKEQELENQLTAAKNAENETEKESVQEKLDALDEEREKYDELYEEKKEALDQYEETLNLSEEAKAQAEEYLREIQALNLEKLEYEIEIRVEVNERDIAYLEQRLERIGSNSSANISKRISNLEFFANEYKSQAYGYREDIQEALRLVNAENPDDRITKDAAKKIRNESVDNLFYVENSLIEGFEQITSELEEAMGIEEEKLGRYYDKTEGFLALMEHYKEIVSLTEGEKSYENMNKLLRNSQKILKDRIKIDEKEVEIWSSARQDLEKRINSGEFKNNERGLAEAEATLNSLIEKEEEAKSKVREDIAELGAYATEIFENSIELATKNFEERMFGGPLSDILNSIEMMNARQEELLTTTNKIYETNKMLRNIEKDIEATTNLRAKQAYNEFQNKVKQKQEQSELTQFELDLLTAEYEITKAQIELEEAQNAKNQVRLVRNSEGNYGYVYTSDTKKVADAEQKLEDAKNKYYNTALDGSKKYQEQIYKHIEEWEEKVKEVYQDQTISEEERQKKLKEINDTYDTLIKQDKQLYYMAKAAMEESSYTHQADYDLKGIESTENWSIESQKYIGELQEAQNEYKANTNEVAAKTTENFGDMETAISDTADQSDILKTKTEGLAESMETNLLNSVENATKAWKEYYKVLKEVSAITETEARANIQDTKLNTSNNFAQDIIDEYKLYGIEGADQDYIGGLISQRVQKLKDIYGGYYIDIAQDFEKEIEKALKRGDKETAQAYNDLLWQKNQILKSTDYSGLLEEYLKTEGSSIDDNIAKGLLKMREQKIELLGLTNVKTNQQIIDEYSRTYPTKPVESQQQYKGNEEIIKKEEETIAPTKKDSPKVGDYVEVKSNTRWYANAWGSGKSGNASAGKIKYIYTSNGATHSYNIDGNGWVKLTDLVGYDTGGYTGAWGPEGRMAMLHEKELVLNKQDTENFLTATEILREISKVLDNNALIASLGMINLKAMSIGTPADQVLQQEVTIHADFPNVTDHNEIELAIDNLINAASQHAYRV